MELNILLDLFAHSSEKIDSLWQFFVSVHIAVFGGLLIYHKMKPYQINMTIISYFAFSFINWRAKINEYEFFISIIEDIKGKKEFLDENISQYFLSHSFIDRIYITHFIHIFAFAFVCFLIIKSNKNPLEECDD